ncbi:MAG: MEDS domain-containing protein [Polyangiaceae bacterium]
MSSAVDFPELRVDFERGLPACLASPAANLHAVQFYERDGFLCDTVGKFLGAGLAAGEHVYVLATKRHVTGFLKRIDARILEQARAEGRLSIGDAQAVLRRILVGDMPDPRRFREFIDETLGTRDEGTPVRARAYGELVDLLVKDGNIRAALRLEEMWHDVLAEKRFPLLCAYLMDHFFRQGDSERLMEVCGKHTHVIPTESFIGLSDSNDRLRQIALLQQRERLLKGEVEQRKKLERALSDALRDLGKVEGELLGWVKREQDARLRAELSEGQKEQLLGILGHDLRNPLNTILTTIRLMTIRDEITAPDSRARLERVLASSMRMQRMLEQLLDVASSRFAEGAAIEPRDVCDLAPVVVEVVGEVEAVTPSRKITSTLTSCRVRIDVERVQQVVWSLLNYVIAHTDSESQIGVEVRTENEKAIVGVRSDRLTVDPAQLTRLFASFSLETEPRPETSSLGLGLYLAQRIVTAHGGTMRVNASPETGTKLEAIVPLA